MGCIYHSASCCDLHQNRFPGHSLYDIAYNIAFVVSAVIVAAMVDYHLYYDMKVNIIEPRTTPYTI
jgi:hypothetical protein